MSAPTVYLRAPSPWLAPYLSGIVGYVEHGTGLAGAREPASLDLPLVVCLAGSFRVGFDGAVPERVGSFAGGLHPGFVALDSDGDAACVQLNFTPLGARLALGLPMDALASRVVPLGDLPKTDLADRLADTADWPERLAIAETWTARRIAAGLADQGPEARAAGAAYRLLHRSHGLPRVARLADRLGWSRKRLAARFREEFGLPPKPLARVIRFDHAVRLASATRPDWADIAASCGYSDQAHLVREFRAFTGVSPTAWTARP